MLSPAGVVRCCPCLHGSVPDRRFFSPCSFESDCSHHAEYVAPHLGHLPAAGRLSQLAAYFAGTTQILSNACSTRRPEQVRRQAIRLGSLLSSCWALRRLSFCSSSKCVCHCVAAPDYRTYLPLTLRDAIGLPFYWPDCNFLLDVLAACISVASHQALRCMLQCQAQADGLQKIDRRCYQSHAFHLFGIHTASGCTIRPW